MIETINYKGIDIQIYQDEHTESPDSWGNNDICGWHNDFYVEHPKMTKEIFGAVIGHEDFTEYKEEAKEMKKKYHIFGIDAYIHSGIYLSLRGEGYRCKWDTSDYVGCILVTKKETRSKKKALEIAKGILNIWNDYLSGNVYGYILYDKDTEKTFGGVWGFYGDYNKSGLIENAKEEIDYYLKEQREIDIKESIKHLEDKITNLKKLQHNIFNENDYCFQCSPTGKNYMKGVCKNCKRMNKENDKQHHEK